MVAVLAILEEVAAQPAVEPEKDRPSAWRFSGRRWQASAGWRASLR